MSEERYVVARLDEIERTKNGALIPVRHHFGIEAFGITARALPPGEEVVPGHDEADDGQQELYVVVEGRATFTLDGEERDAPAGTLVFVEPGIRRKAVAAEPGTLVLAVGAKPGAAYVPMGWELSPDVIPLFEAGDYKRAREELSRAAEQYPDNAGILYNLACAEARLGRTNEALGHLRRSVELWDGFREYAREDPDLESIRSHPDFVAA